MSALWAVLLIYALNQLGYIQIAQPLPQWLMNPFGFIYRHLRGSIIPFIMLLLIYFYLIVKIRTILYGSNPKLSNLTYYDRMLNITIASFFGVGVIWTAVGIEGALVNAMGGFQSNPSAGEAGGQLSAFDIMDRLVNGGMLIALSTTIVGGGLGYLLRWTKILLIGPGWDAFFLKD